MNTATTIRTGATIAATLYTVVLLVLGLYPSEFRYLFAYIPALVGYGTVVFDKWAWRWPVIHRFTGRAWVTGTWRVVLVPSPESHIPEGGNRGPITTYMTIEQTFWSLHATLRTKESTSRSSNATIGAPENSGTAEIGFLYDNTPRVEHQPRSPRHEGACRIAVTGLQPKAATGHYYTSRFTAGDMDFTLLDRSTDCGTFAEAQVADPEHISH
ncbi:Cap15 family cyclic dinucleotide receptor domain-containing protein [Streptomyces goshikiensis]|uniref:Cap15 family cyclic dinucleotide receptor domain-containing protein n=1 Tax=Streptomyces goshikiensis TaxID=1942 RepID=UPI0037FCBDAC